MVCCSLEPHSTTSMFLQVTKWLQTGVFSKHSPSAVNQCAMAIAGAYHCDRIMPSPIRTKYGALNVLRLFAGTTKRMYTRLFLSRYILHYIPNILFTYLHMPICITLDPCWSVEQFQVVFAGNGHFAAVLRKMAVFCGAFTLTFNFGGPCGGGKRTRWIYHDLPSHQTSGYFGMPTGLL